MLISYLYRAGHGFAVVALIGLAASPAAGQSIALRNNSPVAALQRWAAGIDAHVPGELDEAATAHAKLKPSERALLVSVAAPFAFYLRQINEIAEPPKVKLSPAEKTLVTALANKIIANGTAAQWLHRAVMFETDVAILAPELTAEAMRDARGPDLAEAIRADDGEAGARSLLNWHWKLARDLVDQRDPQTPDAFPAAWCHAVALYQLDHMLLAELGPHLQFALTMFRGDARIHFDMACYTDAMSSARVQSVMIGERPRDFRPNIPSEESADAQSAAQFSRAMEFDFTFAEPRVRLARLMEKSGKPNDALTLLALASPMEKTPELEYMSHLIAARANGALGQFEDGRLHLKAALQLFPTAQSPLVALSQLALEAGDMDGAVEAASQLRLRPNRGDRDDPWWFYFQASWLGHGKLLDELRKQVRR